MPTYPPIAAGQRITASLLTAMLPIEIHKTATENVNNSDVPQNDNELWCPLEPFASYTFKAHLIIQSPTTAPDCKVGFTVPPGAYCHWTPSGLAPNSTTATGSIRMDFTQPPATRALASLPELGVALAEGKVITAGTPGNLQLVWAQSAAVAENTSIVGGSHLTVRRYL